MTSTTNTPPRPSHSHSNYLPFARLANEQPTPGTRSLEQHFAQPIQLACSSSCLCGLCQPTDIRKSLCSTQSIHTRQNMT